MPVLCWHQIFIDQSNASRHSLFSIRPSSVILSEISERHFPVWVAATVAAASGVGGAKLDNVCGFIENNGEVEAKVDDNEGKLGNHEEEEDDDDKNARLLPLPLSSPSLTPIDRTMGEVVGKTIVAVVVVLATTTHNGVDSDDNDEDGAEVMFAPDKVTAAVIVLDVYIGMMPPQCCCIDCSIVVVLGLLLL